MRHTCHLCAVFALGTFMALSAYGQAVNATILGAVTDISGGAVPNAKVTALQTGTGSSRSVQTNDSGNFTFPDVTPGTYSIIVEIAGFKKNTRSGIEVDVNTSTRVDMQLQPGNVSESIEVTGTPPALQTDRADIGLKLENVETENLPAGGQRNFQSLLNLVPGTTRATFQHSQFFNASSSLQTEVNGQPRMGNNYQLEGIDDNERTGLLQILVPPIEAIQNVDVSTSNFEAELGRASGAVTNVMLKSGTNAMHGALYEFLQNSDLNSRSFFSAAVGASHYNYFGGNVGGPILKNKLFYFGDYLRISDHQASNNTLTIPTATQISGNLSASSTTIYDPATGASDGTGRTPFANNVIPTSRINAVSTKLLALLPAPNQKSSSGSNNYFALLPYHKDTDSLDGKIDYNLTDRDRISGRFSFARPVIFQAPVFGTAGGGPAAGSFEGTGIQRTYSGGLNYDRIMSNTLVMELRFGVAHYHNEAQPSDYGTNDAAAIGIPGVNIGQFYSGQVGINIGSFYSNNLIGYSASLPWVRAEANIDLVNTWTKVLGNHTLKFGGDLRRVRDDLLQDQSFSPRGLYNFAGGQTALNNAGKTSPTSYYNNFASFLLDVPNQAGRDLGTFFPAYRQWEFFGFAQDKWIVSPKLTVDVGIRWEFYPPATPAFKGGFSNYNPFNNTLVIAGVGGNPSNLGMKTRYKNWAPRLGTAYRLNEKTVIRSGFGLSYTPFPDNGYAYNYPIRANNQFDPAISTFGPAVLPDGRTASFQTGFPAPLNVPIPSNGIIPVTAGLLEAQSFNYVNPNFKNPYVISWNLAIQRSLPMKLTLDVAYVGNHGVDTGVSYNLNAATVAGGGNASQPEYGFNNRTASTSFLFAGFSTSYNSMQVKLNRRFSGSFNLTTSYTYGKGMGFQTGDDGGLYFYVNQRRSYARNDFDRTHTFVQSYIYDLPFGTGKKYLTSGVVGQIVGGWRLNGILTVMTGTPFNVTGGSALNTPGSNQTANVVAPITYPKGINVGNPWFSPTSFAVVTQNGVFGNLGRNTLTGPGFFNVDASIARTFRVRERYSLEFRAEGFSATNTPQFANPNANAANYTTNAATNTFGVITGAGGNRTMQLGLKFAF
jgi:hypothetical protein